MVDATSAEVQRNFAIYREMAEGSRGAPEPVTVLHGDRPSVVILSAVEFARLKQRDARLPLGGGARANSARRRPRPPAR